MLGKTTVLALLLLGGGALADEKAPAWETLTPTEARARLKPGMLIRAEHVPIGRAGQQEHLGKVTEVMGDLGFAFHAHSEQGPLAYSGALRWDWLTKVHVARGDAHGQKAPVGAPSHAVKAAKTSRTR